MGAGAAKTGWFLIRVGGETEELRLAKTEGRNAGSDFLEAETEVRHQLLIEAVDIVHGTLGFCGFIPIFVDNENDSSVNKSSCPCR